MMDFEVQHCTRVCARSGRPLADGEEFYAVLVREGAEIRREDYALESWLGPPAESIGWWRSRVPNRESRRPRMAPGEVLLQLFDELADAPDRRDLRYVLALLLVRRRVLQVVEPAEGESDRQSLSLYCPRTEASYHVPVVEPEPARAAEIQVELTRWLFPTV